VIVTPPVREYLDATRPAADPLLAEMQAQGAREGIPILDAQSGALLHVLARAMGARRIVEVGTAIGVSTLHLARALPADGELISFEIDAERHAAARAYLDRDGLTARVDLRLQDARAGLAELTGPFDLAFLDGVKAEYDEYLDLVVPLLRPGGLVAVDNVLMSGAVAENESDGHWSEEQIATARAFNERLLNHPELVATITPVGDGIALAARR
jgi:caffeoyl-CoA O-methyltransferase